MSLRRFLGWEPRTLTATRADGTTVTVTEPEYDVWEQAIQIAYDAWQAGICDGCGQPLAESLWTGEPGGPTQTDYAASYRQCMACDVLENAVAQTAAKDQRQVDMRKDAPTPSTHHRRWHIARTDKGGY